MGKVWSERTRPICPMNLKAGDKACYSQCLYAVKAGVDRETNEAQWGCLMRDDLELRYENAIGNSVKVEIPKERISSTKCDCANDQFKAPSGIMGKSEFELNKPRRGRPPRVK